MKEEGRFCNHNKRTHSDSRQHKAAARYSDELIVGLMISDILDHDDTILL